MTDFTTNVFYGLVRQFGKSRNVVDVCWEDETTDIATGSISTNRTVQNIQSAIICQTNSDRRFPRTGTVKYGGDYDIKSTVVIFERRMLPANFVITMSHYLTFNNKRWQIKDITEHDGGYIIHTKELEATIANTEHRLSVSNDLTLTDSPNVT